jgi:hypothetical protein
MFRLGHVILGGRASFAASQEIDHTRYLCSRVGRLVTLITSLKHASNSMVKLQYAGLPLASTISPSYLSQLIHPILLQGLVGYDAHNQ